MKTLGTHNGFFHADDVFATAILKRLYPDAEVIRTRDEKVLSTLDLVYDVGGGMYDHHTNEKSYRNDIPFAAFGLIWMRFGEYYLSELYDLDERAVTFVKRLVDEQFIQGIDAVDNGVRLEKSSKLTEISEIIYMFNPTWDQNTEENVAFMNAVQLATQIFEQVVLEKIAVYKSGILIEQAYAKRTQKEILVLDKTCNWMQQLQRVDRKKEVLFIIYPDKYEGYRIQVIPKKIGSFEARKDLPLEWGGKNKEELNELIGIEDAIFCHPARFIAGAISFESCWKMALLSL